MVPMRLIQQCPLCSKPLIMLNETNLGNGETIKSYKCGHTFASSTIFPTTEQWEFSSVDGTKKARPYQEEGIKFIHQSGFSCIIADQMRLGKTPQALLALKNAPERRPVLVLVRSANLYQWMAEFKTWVDPLPLGVYPIVGSNSFIPPGFSMYIMSMDTLYRQGTCKACKHAYHENECRSKKCQCRIGIPNDDGMVKRLLEFGFKLVICDEAHCFKNPDSKRSIALTHFLYEISNTTVTYTFPFRCISCNHAWEETIIKQETIHETSVRHSTHCPQCKSFNQHWSHKERINTERKCGVVLLTGTAIKNRAEEYFVPLNLVAPDKITSLAAFRREWLEQDTRGRWNRLKYYRHDAFKEFIKPFVLRREKEDVFTEIPKLNRIFTPITIEDEKLKVAYNAQLKILEDVAVRSNYKFFDTIGELAILRKICGQAKVSFAVNYVDTMLDSSLDIEERKKQKLAMGVHHHSVGDSLLFELEQYGCMKLSGKDSPQQKFDIMKQFETNDKQILVLNMLAGGLGMDFHYIDTVLVLERQWSSADEEQFEFRFYNPDLLIKNSPTNIEYIIAKGTVDEFFYDLVEQKRVIFGETIATHWDVKNDGDSFKDLIEKTLGTRL